MNPIWHPCLPSPYDNMLHLNRRSTDRDIDMEDPISSVSKPAPPSPIQSFTQPPPPPMTPPLLPPQTISQELFNGKCSQNRVFQFPAKLIVIASPMSLPTQSQHGGEDDNAEGEDDPDLEPPTPRTVVVKPSTVKQPVSSSLGPSGPSTQVGRQTRAGASKKTARIADDNGYDSLDNYMNAKPNLDDDAPKRKRGPNKKGKSGQPADGRAESVEGALGLESPKKGGRSSRKKSGKC